MKDTNTQLGKTKYGTFCGSKHSDENGYETLNGTKYVLKNSTKFENHITRMNPEPLLNHNIVGSNSATTAKDQIAKMSINVLE